jgi:hypothetical protein
MREWQAGRAGRYDLDGLITALDGVPFTVIRAALAPEGCHPLFSQILSAVLAVGDVLAAPDA